MTTSNYLKIGLVLLLMAFQGKAFAQTYDVYLCDNGTATLQPNLVAPNVIAATDEVIWTNTTTGVSTTLIGSSPNFPIPTNLPVGETDYTVSIKSVAGCPGDPSTPIKVYKLPATTVSLGTPGPIIYCTNATTPSSTIVATASLPSGAAPLPAGVTYNYAWTFSKNSVLPYNNAEGVIGSDNSGTGSTNIFTMTTTAIGVYDLKVTANYVVASGTFRSGDGAGCATTSSSQTVTVAPKPTTPTISVI